MVSLPLRLRPVILLFGDSITQQGFGFDAVGTGTRATSFGWASLLSRDYSRRADVLNRGYSGYTTKYALDILPSIISNEYPHQPVLYSTIFFGANDAVLPEEARHVPLDEYGQNLIAIVEYMREHLKAFQPPAAESETTETCNSPYLNNFVAEFPVILFTPPPVDVATWYQHRPPRKGSQRNDSANDNAKAYGNVVKKVGKEIGCSVLDVFDLLGGNDHVDVYGQHLRDGLHLSESGNVLVYEGLIQLLKQDHPHLLPMTDGQGKYGETGVPLQGKLWSEFL